MARVSHAEILERLVERGGAIVMLGGIDSGKTTFALDVAETARARGLATAFLDADLGQSTVGPPTCVGLKFCNDLKKVEMQTVAQADVLAFVGSTSPSGHLLPLIVGTGRLIAHARQEGCEVIVVDTSGLITGTYAEVLKYHKLQLIEPDSVVAFERGGELEPLLGIIRRVFPTEITALKVHAAVVERSVEDRAAHREQSFRSYFDVPLQRWRVKTSVFMPSLPPGTDLPRLDGLVVGLEDGKGRCLGIGLLEYDRSEDALRMVSPVSEGAKGLLLGSVRVTLDGKSLGRFDPRDLSRP